MRHQSTSLMKSLHRINNQRFSIRVCGVANAYGFKTVGTMLKALKQAQPSAKWYYNTHFIRGTQMMRELEAYLERA